MRAPGKKKKNVTLTPTEAILESISDGIFTVDLGWRITSFNRAAEEITGIAREEAIGRRCSEVFRSSMCETECTLRRTLETEKPVTGKPGYIIDALRRELDGRFRVGDLASRSPVMQKLFEVLPAIAASPSTVLILGETGRGKELLARTIHSLSPLRRRKEDIPLLVEQFIARFNRLQQKAVRGISAEALSLLMAHDWPGNIRERCVSRWQYFSGFMQVLCFCAGLSNGRRDHS